MKRLSLLALLLSAGAAQAAPFDITDAWFRALPGKLPAGGYFTAQNNTGKDVSITGVSTGRNPKRSKLRRMTSSIRWKAIWSGGRSSSTPAGVRGLIKRVSPEGGSDVTVYRPGAGRLRIFHTPLSKRPPVDRLCGSPVGV